MTIIGVAMVDDSLSESSQSGFLSIDYTQVFQVISDDRNESPFTVVNAPGIPNLYQKYLSPTGKDLFVVNRTPTRVDMEATERKWQVTVSFSNNQQDRFLRDFNGAPVATPPEAVKEVDITYEEINEQILNATLRGITGNAPEGTPGAVPGTIPTYLNGRTTQAGAVINSAGIWQNRTRPAYRKRIAVYRYEASYNAAYFDYLGSINSDTITITEADQFSTTWSETFAPRTLMIKDITKENFWYDSILYYRIGFIMDHIEGEWFHSYVDEGTKRYVDASQINPLTGVTYTGDELNRILGVGKTYGWSEIVTADANGTEMGVGEPVPFNGNGNELFENNVIGTVYLNWNVYTERAFTPLNL